MSSVPRDRTHIQHQILTLAAQHRARSGGKHSPGSCPGTKHSVVYLAKQGIPIPTDIPYTGIGTSIWEGIMMMQFGLQFMKTNRNNPKPNCLVFVVSPATNTHLTAIKLLFSLHKHPAATRVCLQREALHLHLLFYQIPHSVIIFLCLLWSLPKGDNLNAGGAGWNSQSCSVGKEEALCSSLALLSRCRNRSWEALGLHLVSHSIHRDHVAFLQAFFSRDLYELLYLPFPLHMPSELSLPATKSACRTATWYRLKALKTQMCFLEPIPPHSSQSRTQSPILLSIMLKWQQLGNMLFP